MVEATTLTFDQLEFQTEAELEKLIVANGTTAYGDDCRYVLGKLQIEGLMAENIPQNQVNGLAWIKEAAKNNHALAVEYKIYHDIRFGNVNNLEKIQENLEKAANDFKSTKACNTLAEFSHAQKDLADEFKTKAARYYGQSANQGCLIGMHWLGVYYHEGFGVAQNTDKAIEALTIADKLGNGQSAFQLFLVYSIDGPKKDPIKAYKYVVKAVLRGITFFDEMHAYFKENYKMLAPIYIAMKKIPAEIGAENEKEITNLHEAWINELKQGFMGGITNDRMYHRAAGFVEAQQIWMMGTICKYFTSKVLHFSHNDFIMAMKADLTPLLGNTGLWIVKNYFNHHSQKGNDDKKKRARVALEIIQNFLDNGLDQLKTERKYNMINKFSPKKMPEKAIKRHSLMLYSWTHYAPQAYFEDIRKTAEKINQKQTGSAKSSSSQNKCSHCGAPEIPGKPHKRCSQCKQRLYCSVDCQRFDWKNGHNKQCKLLVAEAARAAKK